MVVDPRTLKSVVPARLIDEPQPCRYCGYNLQGLLSNGACPECGRPIKPRVDPRFGDDSLTDAPLGYLRILALGANLMLAGWLGMAIGILALASRATAAMSIVYAGSAIAWWVGVMVVARPRPPTELTTRNRAGEWLGLRLASRFTQAFWVLSGGMMIAATAGGGPAWLSGAAIGAGAIASGGMIAVCLFVANLLDWAANLTMALTLRRVTVLIWLVPGSLVFLTGGLVPAAMAVLGGPQSPVVLIMLVLGVAVSLPSLIFSWCMWDFRQTATWAVANYQDAEAKDRRFIERSHQQAAMGGLADVGVDPAMHPAIKLGSSEVAPPAAPRLHTGNRAKGIAKKKSGDPNPYELAGDEP